MKKIKALVSGLLFAAVACNAAGEKAEFYFYSAKDYENVKASVQTERGAKILASTISRIDERRAHPLALPKEKSGRAHWYVCNTHNVQLRFDWDKPHEHWCGVCKKFLKGLNLDAAWVKIVHQKNAQYLTDCMWAYMATGDQKYALCIRDMLLDYAKLYPTFEEPSAEAVAKDYHLSRMYDQWLDDCVWLTAIAPAYVAAKDVMKDVEKNQIIENLFKLLADQQMNRSGNNNWQVWNNCGRIHLGVVLEDECMIDVALNGKKGLLKAFETEVNPDGWYNEASIGYHFFPLKGFMHSANAVLCRGINLFDAKFEKMFTSVIDATYPDLTVVAHNDGGYAASPVMQAPMYEFAYARMHSDYMKAILSQVYARTERNSVESLLNPDEIKPAGEPLKLESKLFPQTGFAVLRDGKNTATLTFGESHGGHGHPHRLAVTLHNGVREILPDFGTPGYGSPMYRTWYQKTLAHNTVTVDAKDQRFMGLAGKLVNFESFKDGGLVEAVADRAYEGVKMSRKSELRAGKFLDEFKCDSDAEHVYDYALHLRDKPEFENQLSSTTWADALQYDFIRGQKSFKTDKPFTVKTSSADLTITPSGEVEVLTGAAPGPAVSGAESEDDVTVYPVIVRLRGKSAVFKSEWVLK